MANRIELGGYFVSEGEDSTGELRARFWLEYSNALVGFIQEMQIQHGYDSPNDVLADIVAGELDDELEKHNEVDPEEYDREEWLAENTEADVESAESDD